MDALGEKHSTPYEHVGDYGPDDEFHHMKTSELKHWLEGKGADLVGVLERSELEKLARSMAGKSGAGTGTATTGSAPAGGS